MLSKKARTTAFFSDFQKFKINLFFQKSSITM